MRCCENLGHVLLYNDFPLLVNNFLKQMEEKMNKFEIIKKYIDEYDYYALLANGAPSDEFDSYSREFEKHISDKYSVEEIALLIAETMDKAFGEEVNPEHFLETARRIRTDLYEID